jgi:hypothetical protein
MDRQERVLRRSHPQRRTRVRQILDGLPFREPGRSLGAALVHLPGGVRRT